MPAPVTGGVSAGGGGVSIKLHPPIEFILRQHGEFSRRLQHLQPLWDKFGEIMAEVEEEQWATGGHGAWPALAETSDPGPALMVQSGALLDSLTDPGSALRAQSMSAEYGTRIEYAHYHQVGGYIPGRPPQRQVIPDPFPAEARQKLERAMVTFLNDVAADTFGRI
jgi:phage gpG-like protein